VVGIHQKTTYKSVEALYSGNLKERRKKANVIYRNGTPMISTIAPQTTGFRFTYKIDCPICLNARKDCRSRLGKDGGHPVIHCRADISLPQVGNYYRAERDDATGFGQWYYGEPNFVKGKRQSADRDEAYFYKMAAEARLRDERAKAAISKLNNADRDAAYKLLMEMPELSLKAEDRADLNGRGIDDEAIAWFGFRSIESKTILKKAVKPAPAGMDETGRRFSLGKDSSGVWIPIRNWDKEIVAYQVRARVANDAGRYRWGSGSSTTGQARLLTYNNEWPVQVVIPLVITPGDTLNICEGCGAKPLILALQTGRPTIGVVGGQLENSNAQIQDYFKKAQQEYGVTRIVYAPDAGDVGNNQVWDRMTKYFAAHTDLKPSFMWWGQITKNENDVDERTEEDIRNTALVQINALSAIRSKVETPEHQMKAFGVAGARAIYRSVTNNNRRKDTFLPKAAQTTTPLVDVVAHIESGRHLEEVYPITSANRFEIHAKILEAGKYVLDSSMTGTGKSHAYNRKLAPAIQATKYFYVYPDAKNSPIGNEFWEYLPGANRGEILNSVGKRQNAKGVAGEMLSKPPNCIRMDAREVLYSSGVDLNPSEALCNKSCDKYNLCKIPPLERKEGMPMTPSSIGERRAALKRQQIIVHPFGLPPQDSFKYDNVFLVFDEAAMSVIADKEIEVTPAKLGEAYGFFSGNPELRAQLMPLLDWAVKVTAKPLGRMPRKYYGRSILELMADLPDELKDINALMALRSQVDAYVLEVLRAKVPEMKQDGIDREGSPGMKGWERARINSVMYAEYDRVTMAAVETIAGGAWVMPFLDVLLGECGDIRSLRHGGMAITIPESRIVPKIKQAGPGKVVFLDATIKKAELAAKLHVDPSEIVEVKEGLPTAEDPAKMGKLNIIQVPDFGMLTRDRSPGLKKRVAAAIEGVKEQFGFNNVGVFDFSSDLNSQMTGRWFVDDRGDNSYQAKNALILVGTPIKNVGAMLSKYNVWYNKRVGLDDEGFKDFLDEMTNATFEQAIGRTRYARRLCKGEDVTVYIFSDFEFPFHTDIVRAQELHPDAGSKADKFRLAMFNSRERIEEEMSRKAAQGLDPLLTYAELADVAGVSKSTVARLFHSLMSEIYISPEDYDNMVDDMNEVTEEELVVVEEAVNELNEVLNLPDHKGNDRVDAVVFGELAKVPYNLIPLVAEWITPVARQRLATALLTVYIPSTTEGVAWIDLLIKEFDKKYEVNTKAPT
jgi:hypothetical protein